jgi:hypothetical protein
MLDGPALDRLKTRSIRVIWSFTSVLIILVQVLGGHARAESHEGLLAYVRGEYGDAARLLRPLAEAGDIEAQFLLGHIFELGLGGTADNQAAAAWYLLAAQGGDPAAQHSVGLMYADGRGVPWDFLEAYVWLSLAMVGLPPGAEREDAITTRRLVRTVLTAQELRHAEERLVPVVG